MVAVDALRRLRRPWLTLSATIALCLGVGAARKARCADAGRQDVPLRVEAVATHARPEALRAGDASDWRGAPETAVLMHRTPPLYSTDPSDDSTQPDVRVAVLHADDRVLVRLRWIDRTENVPPKAGRWSDGGDSLIYKEHSEALDQFADAACVMVPVSAPSSPAWPSLMMGDPEDPVELYYWHASRGFQRLRAAGRGTTQATDAPCEGSVRRTATGWEVVFDLPGDPQKPMAFAVWDGALGHRDGLKWFSPWYQWTEVAQ